MQAERRRCSNAVPLEPLEDYEGKMAKVRFRCPNGETMMRRFRAEETLGMLLNFLGSESYPVGKFKLLTSFPRRDVSLIVFFYSEMIRLLTFLNCTYV